MSDKTELNMEAERASFESWARDECRMPPLAALNWNAVWTKAAWDGWLAARRATIQPTAAIRAPSSGTIDGPEFRDLLWKFQKDPCSCDKVNDLVCYIDARRATGSTDDNGCWTDGVPCDKCNQVGWHVCRAPVAPADAVRDARGYFGAVAVALREDGPSTVVRSLFSQGGDPTKADPYDIELFVEHGLMQPPPKEPAK